MSAIRIWASCGKKKMNDNTWVNPNGPRLDDPLITKQNSMNADEIMWDAKSQSPLSVFPKKNIYSDHSVHGNHNEYRRRGKRRVSLQNEIEIPKFYERKDKKKTSQ